MMLIVMSLFIPNLTLAAPEQPSDEDITNAIESHFWGDDVVDPNRIEVNTRSGIVTLSGEVDNILAKDRAAEITGTIVGVRGIVNQIEVEPRHPVDDAELKKNVQNALFQDPATDSYEVRAQASNGIVTLTGTVDSWPEKQLFTTVAKSVQGVREVKNNIGVEYRSERLDREIKAEVEARLANDVRVDDNLIDVRVKDGHVYLSGAAGSLAEKNRARADGWVGGVESVDAEDLSVEWWARDRMRREKSYVLRSDEELEQAVKDAFRYDPRVYSYAPEVEVDSAVVTLSGVVHDLEAKRAAESDARNVVGVVSVVNHLKVRPASIPPDNELEKRVGEALSKDPYVDRLDVAVDARNGLVYLRGDVNNSFEKEHARSVAEGVKGVTAVINNLTSEYSWTWRPDWQIREAVKDELFWSPFVDQEEVSVTVEQGVVTLTGRVDTWSERHSAETNAWEGGAKDVRNKLSVVYRTIGPDAGTGPHYPYLFPYER